MDKFFRYFWAKFIVLLLGITALYCSSVIFTVAANINNGFVATGAVLMLSLGITITVISLGNWD